MPIVEYLSFRPDDKQALARAAVSTLIKSKGLKGGSEVIIRSPMEVNSELARLPGVLARYMDYPSGKIPDRDALRFATVYSLSARGLQPAWEMLHHELEVYLPDDIDPKNFLRYTYAAVLAHGLVHQSQLPVDERAFVIQSRNDPRVQAVEETRDAVASLILADELFASPPIVGDIQGQLATFIDVFEQRMISPATTVEAAQAQVAVASGLMNVRTGGCLNSFWEYAADDNNQRWFREKSTQGILAACLNPVAQDLLREGNLTDINPKIEELVWTAAMSKMVENPVDASGAAELMGYFLSHPSVQEIFWGTFAGVRFQTEFSKHNQGADVSSTFFVPGAICKWVFSQDQSLVERFLETVQLPASKWDADTQTQFLKHIISFIGQFKEENSDHPNIAYLGDTLLEKIGSAFLPVVGRVSKHLAVVANSAPGVIYSTPNGDVRVKKPRVGQSSAEFTAAVRRDLPEIIYQSTFSEQPDVRAAARMPEILKISSGERLSSIWGEALKISGADVSSVTNWLVKRLNISPDTALDWVVEQQRRMIGNRRENPLVILPDLMNKDHPLVAALGKLGVIGLKQQDDEVIVLLDPSTSRIETSVKRLALTGNLGGDLEELIIPGSAESFDFSAVQLTLTAAALMARTAVIEPGLERADVAYLRGLVNGWNRVTNMPRLVFQEDPTRPRAALQTIAFVGKKPVILDVIER